MASASPLVFILDHVKHYSRRTRDTLVQDGIMPFLWRTAVKCASPFGRLGIVNLYEKDLTAPLTEVRSRVRLTVGEATSDDLDALTGLRMLDQDMPAAILAAHMERDLRLQIIGRFQRGWKCYVARAGGEIVHCTWLARSWAESIGHRFIIMKDDEAYTADAYTAKAWRSKGLHRLVKFHILSDLQKAGFRTAYVLVHVDCRPSKWVQVLLGYTTLGTVLYFASHRLRRTWVLPLRGTSGPFLEHTIPPPQPDAADLAGLSCTVN